MTQDIISPHKNEIKYIIPSDSTVPRKLLEVTKTFLDTKGRRYFGQAAVSLENQLNDPKYKELINRKLITLGIDGEKSTSQYLRKWIADKPQVVLLDSLHLDLKTGNEEDDEDEPDEETGQVNSLGDTDHLLIIGETIFLIDSKNWKEKTTYSITEHGHVLRNKRPFNGNTPKANQNKYLWKKFYEGVPIKSIESFVCISNPNSPIVRDVTWWKPGFLLVNQETLIYFLNRKYNELHMNEIDYIRVDLVAKALTGLQKPYNTIKEKYPELWERTRIKK